MTRFTDRLVLWLGGFSVIAIISVVTIVMSTRSAVVMREMPENAVIKNLIRSEIAPAESWFALENLRLIPERSQHGRYLTGELKGHNHGRFTYSVALSENDEMIMVEWHRARDKAPETLIISSYRKMN